VKDTVAGFQGRADWDSDWTMISDGREKEHDTTLVGLEKDFKSVPSHKKSKQKTTNQKPRWTTSATMGKNPKKGR